MASIRKASVADQFGDLSLNPPKPIYAYRLLRQDEDLSSSSSLYCNRPDFRSYNSFNQMLEMDCERHILNGKGTNIISASLSIGGLNKFIIKHHEKYIRVVKISLGDLPAEIEWKEATSLFLNTESMRVAEEHDEVLIFASKIPSSACTLEYEGPRITLPHPLFFPGMSIYIILYFKHKFSLVFHPTVVMYTSRERNSVY